MPSRYKGSISHAYTHVHALLTTELTLRIQGATTICGGPWSSSFWELPWHRWWQGHRYMRESSFNHYSHGRGILRFPGFSGCKALVFWLLRVWAQERKLLYRSIDCLTIDNTDCIFPSDWCNIEDHPYLYSERRPQSSNLAKPTGSEYNSISVVITTQDLDDTTMNYT